MEGFHIQEFSFLSRPIPIDGESLTSYIQRLAKANSVGTHSVWFKLLPPKVNLYNTFLASRIDRAPDEVLDIEVLSRATGFARFSLELMTFLPVIKKLWNCEVKWAFGQNVLRGLLTKNLRFCPICLREEPHYALIWQVSELDICMKHQTLLEEACPKCCRPVIHLANNSEVGCCSYCNAELSSVKPRYKDIQKSHLRIVNDWNYLLNPAFPPLVWHKDLYTSGNMLIKKLLYLAFQNSATVLGKKMRIVTRLFIDNSGLEILYPNLKSILIILRKDNISLKEFSELIVPAEFEISYPSNLRLKTVSV